MKKITSLLKNYLFQALILVVFLLFVYQYFFSIKIVYVRSEVLISGYTGTKEAYALFENERKNLEANIDTMNMEYQNQIQSYNNSREKLSKEERINSEQYLDNQRNSLIQYTDVINEKIKEKEKKLSQDLFNQINSYIEEYSKRKGYDIVMGTTNSGNLLYGNKALDITDDLLLNLNNNYKTK